MTRPSGREAVITGGAGFIGSTLVDRLLGDGWTVVALDAFEGSYARERKLENLDRALTNPAFRLVEADTRDTAAIRGIFREVRPQVVFDLAARAGVRPSIADPIAYVDTNVRGLQNTLVAAAGVGARVVFASSSSIYGDSPRRPFREDDTTGRPVSPYGATKLAGEALVHAHHAVSGLPIGIARLFTVYGPRQRPDLAICAFADRILQGRPVELYDRGLGLRDYTYVDDVVDALVRLAAFDAPALVVNIGSDRPIETRQVVAELETQLGVRANRQLLPPQAGDVAATHADISVAREKLGWQPRMLFEDGIARFCEWLIHETGGRRHAAANAQGAGGGPPIET